MVTLSDAKQNELLAGLPDADLAGLLELLHVKSLGLGESVYEAGYAIHCSAGDTGSGTVKAVRTEILETSDRAGTLDLPICMQKWAPSYGPASTRLMVHA